MGGFDVNTPMKTPKKCVSNAKRMAPAGFRGVGAAMTDDNRIVAVGLLSALDLERLGPGFERAYPVAGDHAFADLIGALDRIPWNAAERGAEEKGADRV